ncbi:MAG TPA: hypothetical protein LFV66_03485 [Rickettsia endosymbiont of Bembidion lapponicum]|nr:hypothetical protein [Rickettsia endosymbiont of Bembidion lapponicum]
MMLTHHGAHGKLKLFHLEDGGFNHQRDYKYNLNIPRYVDTYEEEEEIDVAELQKEIQQLEKE